MKYISVFDPPVILREELSCILGREVYCRVPRNGWVIYYDADMKVLGALRLKEARYCDQLEREWNFMHSLIPIDYSI